MGLFSQNLNPKSGFSNWRVKITNVLEWSDVTVQK